MNSYILFFIMFTSGCLVSTVNPTERHQYPDCAFPTRIKLHEQQTAIGKEIYYCNQNE